MCWLGIKPLFFSVLCIGSLLAHASNPIITPEAASGFSAIKSANYSKVMAVTANPHASRAAVKILRQGGSAVDAAIAAQLVLGLVEPQSSGIGGGAFMLHWQARSGELVVWDGRETAPASVSETYYMNTDGQSMDFFSAVIGGHSVGVPGVLAMLEASHKEHGKLPWANLFKPAIILAEQGFAISERLHTLLSSMPKVAVNPQIREYFFNRSETGWQPKAKGSLLQNLAYAQTLRRLAALGVTDFYQGELAKQIVQAVNNDLNRPGRLSLSDMNAYQPKKREALCGQFRIYRICGVPPPSSGGTTVLAILSLLEAYEIRYGEHADWQHGFIEASKLAFADRNAYVGDPAFVSVPTQGMIDQDYLHQRAMLIRNNSVLSNVSAGSPPGAEPRLSSNSPELPSTTHLSIVDIEGNVVSMTSSIETAFGSRIMVGGFLLNNQLTDFSFMPKTADGVPVANRVQSGKRPRSSMSPTVVFKDGRALLVIGSPGGTRIINYVAGSLYRILARRLPIAEAIADGHIVAMGYGVELESGRVDEPTLIRLRERGHNIVLRDQTSGLHVIRIDEKAGLEGGADPRREGEISGF
ncbi:gamma-glutamyltransferase [Nitrosomonas ureae]|uniref:Glutathione hydrolase proenzyme n=1 Tax=Nitrosomonas ureae TaxID=44577 RepID=A0A1H5UV95_9PROT|nr:gamma-glutamyltransferase [Nitrosomonas ureae]SEF78900.1 gamma-glutamyltransferase 1 Threonine peptidase. MEROPS family T03 [Nitrosomonas ureae]